MGGVLQLWVAKFCCNSKLSTRMYGGDERRKKKNREVMREILSGGSRPGGEQRRNTREITSLPLSTLFHLF